MKHALALVSFSVLSITLLGCKPDAAIRQGEPVGAGPSVPLNAPNPATLGTVAGTVKISGKVPAPIRIDMSQDPACTLGDAQNVSEQIVAQKGNLANVYIYIQNAPSVPAPASMQPVVINQKGCRFTPHVAAVMQGGTVQFTNSDPTMHNVHTMPVQAGNRTVDVSQGPGGKPEELRFATPETMLPIRCNNHPWMNAFLNVSASPFFAITGPDGQFQISGLPAGSYTLAFVHEKLGTLTMPITVTAQRSTTANITYPAP